MIDLTRGKKLLKAAMGRVIFATGLYRLWFRERAVIVVFHRVDDALEGNPISCSSRAFDAFCRFFARYFEVVSLGELVNRLNHGRSISRCLVVTFDDGYRDNREIAAPTLQKYRLPACFFVATDFIGTERAGWWDEARGIQSRWMSWDDVQALERMGLEVGAHTKSHVDLGRVMGEKARDEIEGSGKRLTSELGAAVDLFSYPYGRKEHITEENREIVRKAGYRCCCSAYGGDVRPDSDPWDLRRIAVSPWYEWPYQLGFELLVEGDQR